MMFLVTVPLIEGLASFALPVLLGARELPFPRMTAFGFWTFLFGAILLYTSRAFGAGAGGRVDRVRAAREPGVLAGPRGRFLAAGAERGRGGGAGRRHRAGDRRAEDARAGHDPEPDAGLRLVDPGHGLRDAVRLHAAAGRHDAAGAGAQARDALLRSVGRRRPAALAAPVLDLRPPGRLHPVHPGDRARLAGHRGVRPSPARGRDADRGVLDRHGRHQLRPLGPPPVQRRAVRAGHELLRGGQHVDRHPQWHPGGRLDRHALAGPPGLHDGACCSRWGSSSRSSRAASPG